MQIALYKALADFDNADSILEMGLIVGQFYAGYTDKDEVARGIVVQLRVHRAPQHRHCWALAANRELWKWAINRLVKLSPRAISISLLNASQRLQI